MISNERYVQYETFNSKESVLAFLNEGAPLISNNSNYREDINKIIEYTNEHKKDYKINKNGRAYNNIFGHYLKVLIPYEIEKENWQKFINKYVELIDRRFKKLTYVYKFRTQGKGNYAEIMLFTRTVYKKGFRENKKYNQDYYYDSTTGKRCKQDNDNAVLKCKKGTVITKEDGTPITQKVFVKAKQERIFFYKSFNKFQRKLKNKLMKAMHKMLSNVKLYKVISKVTVRITESRDLRKSKYTFNENVTEINKILKQYQDGINDGKFYNSVEDIYKQFQQLLNKVDEMIHKEYVEFALIKKFLKNWWIENVAEDFI